MRAVHTTTGLLCALLALASCGREPASVAQPVCFPKRPASELLTPLEEKALAMSMRMAAERCSAHDTQCGYRVRTEGDKGIVVRVEFETVDGDPPRCLGTVGNWYYDEYDATGRYLSTSPGF